jgi:hypothetical protein
MPSPVTPGGSKRQKVEILNAGRSVSRQACSMGGTAGTLRVCLSDALVRCAAFCPLHCCIVQHQA